MREIQQATALTELVSSGHQNAIDIGVLYVMVRHMHETGFYHGRLDLRNIVRGIDADGVSDYHIIDTPYAMIFPGSIAGTAMAWDDLRQLSGYVYRIWGTEVVRAGLIGYGLGKKESHKMMGILPRSGVPLLMRNLKRFYFGLRLRFFYKYEIF
ncbi:MAG: hypothetical protein A2498_15715 [Lentisphaerae bacterium RIFOXYC12_FULL_60_16]|nr:MAG: hypothetical protein A2498_15715 [Lentisphaerae bacterium RIFOXYC12_FULL_60_16]